MWLINWSIAEHGPAFRTRPFAKVPDPVTSPNSIFVTALDTNPLAADPSVVLQGYEKEFSAGLAILARLTDGPVHVCHAQGKSLPKANDSKINLHEVVGPHPAGLAGYSYSLLRPCQWPENCLVSELSRGHCVWPSVPDGHNNE